MAEDRPKAPPGWYDYDDQQRYWDGEHWGSYRPKPPGWYDVDETRQAYWTGEQWGAHRPKPGN